MVRVEYTKWCRGCTWKDDKYEWKERHARLNGRFMMTINGMDRREEQLIGWKGWIRYNEMSDYGM